VTSHWPLSIRFQHHATWTRRRRKSVATWSRADRRFSVTGLDQLDIQTQRLQLANQHVERLRHARFHGGFALDDGLVNLSAAINVVGLRRQQLLQDESRAVGLKRPDFHFSEALSAKLGLAPQWLLRNERVRPDGTRMDLVVHQMREFQHVDVADRNRLLEFVARHAVVQVCFSRLRQSGTLEQCLNFGFARSVEYWGSGEHAAGQRFRHRAELVVWNLGDFLLKSGAFEQCLQFAADGFFARVLFQQLCDFSAELVPRPAKVSLENLPDVHTRRNAKRIEDDFYRGSILEVRHIFIRQNASDYALITVPASHLVSHAQLALHGDIALDQLDHAGRQFIALGQLVFLLVDDLLEHVDLTRGHFFDLIDLFIHPRIFVGVLNTLQVPRGNALDRVTINNVALAQQALVGALVVQVSLDLFASENVLQTLQPLVGKNANLVGKVLFELRNLRRFNGLRPLVFFLALAGENFHIDYHALDSGGAVERSIAYVSGFFTEDRSQQLLFRRELGLAFWCDLAHQNVALLDVCANADHAGFIQIAQRGFADIWNVARDFLWSKFRIARLDLEFLNMDRGVVILLHQLFGDEDR